MRFVPEPVPGAQSTADYPQHVPDPVDVVRTVWSAGRGEGMSHRLPESGGTHRGAKLGCVFAKGAMQRKPTSQCYTAANSWDCAPVAGGTHVAREIRQHKKHVVHVCILCHQ